MKSYQASFLTTMLRLDINYGGRGTTVKNTNTGRLNNTCLNNERVTEETKREKKKNPKNK